MRYLSYEGYNQQWRAAVVAYEPFALKRPSWLPGKMGTAGATEASSRTSSSCTQPSHGFIAPSKMALGVFMQPLQDHVHHCIGCHDVNAIGMSGRQQHSRADSSGCSVRVRDNKHAPALHGTVVGQLKHSCAPALTLTPCQCCGCGSAFCSATVAGCPFLQHSILVEHGHDVIHGSMVRERRTAPSS
jgi:hypothetical protein